MLLLRTATESVRGEACEDKPDAGLDVARGTRSLTCEAAGGSRGLATIICRGPRDLTPTLAVAQAEAVDAELRELSAPILWGP